MVGCIVALKKQEIARSAGVLFLSVFLLYAIGFALGYLAARCFKCPASVCRTISVEVGMQNSGLGASLATKHFANLALAPVPAAVSAIYHCLIGSLLAAWWKWRDSRINPAAGNPTLPEQGATPIICPRRAGV